MKHNNYKNNNDRNSGYGGCVVWIIVFIAIAVALGGCINSKKASAFMRAHPDVNAPICADQFPPKDSLVKGDTIITTDTLESFEVVRDTSIVHDTVRITTTFPARVITTTKSVHDTVFRENTARVATLTNLVDDRNLTISKRDDKISTLEKDFGDMKGNRNRWRLWFWIAVGAAGAYTFLKIRKVIPF